MELHAATVGKEINEVPHTELVAEILRLEEKVARLTNQREILQGELLRLHDKEKNDTPKK